MSISNIYPGVYVEETASSSRTISGVSTSDTAFVDFFPRGPLEEPTRITSFEEFKMTFGAIDPESKEYQTFVGVDTRSEASYGIRQFFLNGGSVAWVVRVAATHEPPSTEWIDTEGADALLGRGGDNKGIYALKAIPSGFNILCLPAAANLSSASLKRVYDEAAEFCNHERAFLIVDTPTDIDTPEKAIAWFHWTNSDAITRDKNAAVYFPRLTMADPVNQDQSRNVGPSGTMAGIYARTDRERGVWKAPAGTKADLRGVNIVTSLTDHENGKLNDLAINALRSFPAMKNVCWGARTLASPNVLGSEWKYIPVRRTALFVEQSIYRGIEWVVFEPNDEPLWSQIRREIGQFMYALFLQGAFQGITPKDAYFIKCDSETTTQDDINSGIVNILVGFAPLKPAEFVIIKIQQLAGQDKGQPGCEGTT